MDAPLFAGRVGEVGEVVADRVRVTGPGGGGRVGGGGHGADVLEGAVLSWRPMVEEVSDPRPDGLNKRGGGPPPRATRHPRLMRTPWTEAVLGFARSMTWKGKHP